MPLTLKVTRGITLSPEKPLTVSDLNLLGLPTVELSGAVGSSDLATGAVGREQLRPGRLCVGAATGVNSWTVVMDPGPSAHEAGSWLWIVPEQTNTGPITLMVNALPVREVVRSDGGACVAGDVVAKHPCLLAYHEGLGKYVLLNPAGQRLLYGEDLGTANAMKVNWTWALPSLTALTGRVLLVQKGSDTNTGALTLEINQLGAVDVWHGKGRAFKAGECPGESLLLLVYDGVRFSALAGYQTSEDGGDLTAGEVVSVDISQGSFFRLNTGTFGGNLQLNPNGTAMAGYSLMIMVTYGTGTNPKVVGPAGTWWAGGAEPETGTPGRRDLVSLTWTGSNWIGMYRVGFA